MNSSAPFRAVLMLNLGSPDSTKVADVRRYLREFLSDERVIDAPAPVRAFVLNACILPFRPKQSAEAYARVWTEEGSPLLVTSQKQRDLVAAEVEVPIYLAMRYGEPSIPKVVGELQRDGIEELLILPLYPHYAMSSYETVVVRVMEELAAQAPKIKTTLVQPFYQDEDYIEALVESARPYLEQAHDYLLFSFHGIPERHLRKSDPSHAHCLTTPDCCNTCHPAHATCYRHQCFATVKAFAAKAGLDPAKFGVSFQSRLGRDPWLTPYTDETIENLGKKGIRKLLVICPAFISDCLETLEEIAMEGGETFEEHGGEALTLIPCLNTHPAFIRWTKGRIEKWLATAASAPAVIPSVGT